MTYDNEITTLLVIDPYTLIPRTDNARSHNEQHKDEQ